MKKTPLREMLDKGHQVVINSIVPEGSAFTFVDPATDVTTVAVHPLDYSYLAYDDPWRAHEINMLWIQAKIDRMAAEACEKLDRMVYEMEHKHDPKIIAFMPNVEVEENEDGTFTFNARPAYPILPDEPLFTDEEALSLFKENAVLPSINNDNSHSVVIVEDPDLSYDDLVEKLSRKPTFDELMRGY